MKYKNIDEELYKIVFDRLLSSKKTHDLFFYSKNKIIMNILKETDGYLIFQEQWLKILMAVFNISAQDSVVQLKNIVKKNSNGLVIFNELYLKFPLLSNELDKLKYTANHVMGKTHFNAKVALDTLKMMYPND